MALGSFFCFFIAISSARIFCCGRDIVLKIIIFAIRFETLDGEMIYYFLLFFLFDPSSTKPTASCYDLYRLVQVDRYREGWSL